jgi:hypothetical protein
LLFSIGKGNVLPGFEKAIERAEILINERKLFANQLLN